VIQRRKVSGSEPIDVAATTATGQQTTSGILDKVFMKFLQSFLLSQQSDALDPTTGQGRYFRVSQRFNSERGELVFARNMYEKAFKSHCFGKLHPSLLTLNKLKLHYEDGDLTFGAQVKGSR
jgi:hypothetical protein